MRKVLKHAPTRWLSLHKCLDRSLKLWDGLKSYFLTHYDDEEEVDRAAATLDEQRRTDRYPKRKRYDLKEFTVVQWRLNWAIFRTKAVSWFAATVFAEAFSCFRRSAKKGGPREERLVNVFKNLTTQLYIHFLHAVLPNFDTFNTLLQTEAPMIHRLYPSMIKLYKVRKWLCFKSSKLLKFHHSSQQCIVLYWGKLCIPKLNLFSRVSCPALLSRLHYRMRRASSE